MIRIEHIGIAVKELDKANELFAKLFDEESYKSEKVDSEEVTTTFFKIGPNKIELLAADNEDSAIAKYLNKKGEGIHHIAFEVDDIFAEMDRLSKKGFELINKEPKAGADNKLICFLHPKSTNGVLVELCQEIKNK